MKSATADAVARAALETLELWLVPYLAHIERQEGLTARSLPQPKSFVLGPDITALRVDDAMPQVAVLSPGLSGDPQRGPLGNYHLVPFALAAGVFVKANSRDETRALLSRYCAAIRLCLLAEGLKGVNANIEWDDETYDEAPDGKHRTIGGGEVAFTVYLNNPVTLDSRPYGDTPPADPYEPPGPGPTVESTHLGVNKLPLA